MASTRPDQSGANSPDSFPVEHAPQEVLAWYPLRLRSVEPLETGSFNTHFRVVADEGLFDLRRSGKPSSPESLLYEASALSHLQGKGFGLGPAVFVTRDGSSNMWHEGQGWTLFHWLGEGPKVARQELTMARWEEAARVLAQIHMMGKDFQPEGARGDWPIFAGPEDWGQRWLERARSLASELGPDGESLMHCAFVVARELESIDAGSLSVTLCHGDYRMANLRFEGDRLAAVFDFDVAFQTTRLLDIGRLLIGFGRGTEKLQLHAEEASHVLSVYNEAAPLTEEEWDALPVLLKWRWVRDSVAYFDRFWLDVRETAELLLFGRAAEAIVNRVR